MFIEYPIIRASVATAIEMTNKSTMNLNASTILPGVSYVIGS